MAIVRTFSIYRNRPHDAQARRRALLRAAVAALALCLTLTWATQADMAAFDFDEPGRGITVSGTDGFQFRPNRDLVVTALGYYDRERDGLNTPHPVALFSVLTRSSLVSATVSPSSPLIGNFRYERTPPVVLEAGHSYVIAAFTSGNEDPPADSPGDLRVASPINYEGYLFEFGATLGFPTNTDLFSSRTFFGPNFRFRPAAPGLVSQADHRLRERAAPSKGSNGGGRSQEGGACRIPRTPETRHRFHPLRASVTSWNSFEKSVTRRASCVQRRRSPPPIFIPCGRVLAHEPLL